MRKWEGIDRENVSNGSGACHSPLTLRGDHQLVLGNDSHPVGDVVDYPHTSAVEIHTFIYNIVLVSFVSILFKYIFV